MEAAADWCDREVTPAGKAALQSWLAADPDHARAFALMRRTMLDVALLDAAEAVVPVTVKPARFALGAWLQRALTSRSGWGVLVGAAAAVCAVFYVLFSVSLPPTPRAETAQIFATATGQQSTAALADRSVVFLNAGTRLEVRYSARTRALHLLRGEAIFQVTKDKARPFQVITGTATVTAVGTRFGVDLVGDAVEVRVFEGTVKVAGGGAENRTVTRGQWLLIDPARGVSAGSFAPDGYPNWRTGWLEADRMPLPYVIARLNRYTDDKIALADEKLAGADLSGRFRLDNTADTLKQIAALLDINVTQHDHRILLTPKQPTSIRR